MHKLYIQPHLDYGDVTYHIPYRSSDHGDSVVLTNQVEKRESVQYSAALAVTGAW